GRSQSHARCCRIRRIIRPYDFGDRISRHGARNRERSQTPHPAAPFTGHGRPTVLGSFVRRPLIFVCNAVLIALPLAASPTVETTRKPVPQINTYNVAVPMR